jgi:DNA-binding transcriptional MerR regulator
MQIGEVAERTGLSLRTIRYYEEVGLVTPSARTPGGFRVYTTADAERLELVKRMKSLEFTLEETRLLLTLLSLLGGDLPGDERRRRLEELATSVHRGRLAVRADARAVADRRRAGLQPGP